MGALRSRREFNVARCGPNPIDIHEALHRFKADVALLGLAGSPDTLCRVVQSVHRKYPECKIVTLISETQRNNLPELFRVGARGVINMGTADIDLICKCILEVNQGHFWVSSRELDLVLQEFSRSFSLQIVNSNGQKLLTQRELEVVRLIADGLTNRDVAKELKISPYTVRNYLSQIFDKVGVSTRTELVRFAVASGRPRTREAVAPQSEAVAAHREAVAAQ
jgi:DNA-binding NarL/FixJ family response regulator